MGTSYVPTAAPVVARCLPPEQRRGHPEAVTSLGSPTRSAQSWDSPPGSPSRCHHSPGTQVLRDTHGASRPLRLPEKSSPTVGSLVKPWPRKRGVDC